MGLEAMARWRMHLAAAVVLLLVLGISAVGGTGSTRVAATGAGTAGASESVGGDGTRTETIAGQPEAAPGVSGVAATPVLESGRPGTPAPAGRTGIAAGHKITYDIGASDTEVKMGGSTFTSGPAATYGEQIAVGFAGGVNYINDHGGINGRRMTVKIYDDGADPADGTALA